MDHHEKLSWAEKHLNVLKDEIDAFLDDEPISTRVEIDRERQRITIYGGLNAQKPTHWPLMIGDIVHNLRSALDHIVWEFSTRNMAVKKFEELKAIQFPICTKRGEYWGGRRGNKGDLGQRERRMKWVAEAARVEVDAMQPYHALDLANSHPLAMLNELSNEDKHHKLVVMITDVRVPHITFRGFGGAISPRASLTEYFVTSAEGETPVAMWEFSTPIPESDVQVQPHPSGAIIFDDSMRAVGGLPVVETLKYIADSIRDGVFPRLDALLG